MHAPWDSGLSTIAAGFIKYFVVPNALLGHTYQEHDMQVTTRLVWDRCRSSAIASAGVREQTTFHDDNGCPALRQRIIHVEPGSTAGFPPAQGDDVLFVLAGKGRLRLGAADDDHALVPETGVYVRPGESYEIVADGDETLEVVAVEIPDPPTGIELGERRVTLNLNDAEAQQATANREFRLVVTPEAGCPSITQFVGYIPVGRAPDHFHTYDEVLYVLSGEGVLHIGDSHEPVKAGACIHFSPELVHSLENSGTEPMQVLGVFRPAGSPSEAYYPDGTRATY
jgi:mannose-6-phosphate isomerase-like protein (cupin superfamily)